MRIANQIREVMPEAIERATDGGDMTMDVRSLYYAVRDIFLKRHHPEKSFYKEYDSFSQDFLPKYERETGGIGNLVRAPRGSIATPQFHGGDITSPPYTYGVKKEQLDEREKYPSFGAGNKVILMEKEGLYTAMIENEFPKMLSDFRSSPPAVLQQPVTDAL